MDTIRLLAIFAENKTGQLGRVTGLLAEANVNIRWVTIATSEAFGVIKLLADDHEMAYHQLKHNGVPVSLLEVLAIEVEDRPGGLHKVATCLASNNVNILNSSGFVCRGRAVLLVELEHPARAKEILEKQGLTILGKAALFQALGA